jgi:sugar/nucleoside kinase (ribokinase family)
MNADGVYKNNFNHEMRAFYKILSQDNYDTENPIKYFSILEDPFPRHLLGYSGIPFSSEKRNKSSPITLQTEFIPTSYADCTSALLCSVDFLSISMLPPYLRMNGIKNLLLKPSSGSMNSNFWNEIPVLVRGSTGLICTKKEALNLFLGKSENLMEIIESLAGFGLEFVIITCGKDGQYIYNRSDRTHWEVPAYPIKVLDCIHASDTFAGGFLAGFLKYYDPLMAAMYGNIAASIKLEGNGAFYLLDALPELAIARLDILKERVTRR